MRAADASDALDAASLRAMLPEPVRARIATLDVVDEIDSTNSELLRRRTPTDGIVALFAERQSGGRGRHGRAWASPPGGNLYLSLARCFEDGSLARLGGLSLAVGVAAAEALHALGADMIRVKWPNDLVVGNRDHLSKLGGVLIEGGLQDGRPRAVIGLGLNLRMPENAANAIDQPWTDLDTLLGGSLLSRRTVASTVLASLIEALDCFDAEGLAPFLPRFAALDALRDAPVTATIGATAHAGIAAGVAGDGALRLRTDAGEMLLRAGEVGVRARDPLPF
jgi:BirA family transcriptional regulator, biotin operon repressor / biotin---[acetyl-CoA-carboxylase] ligase